MTDGPDDILRGLIEGESEGPEATPEQEALVSGLLDAIADLSGDSPQLRTLASTTLERGRTALAAWRTWQRGMMPRTG